MSGPTLTHTNKRPGSTPQRLPERHVLARVLDATAFEGMVWPPDWPIEDAAYVVEGSTHMWRAILTGRRKTALATADRILALGWRRADALDPTTDHPDKEVES